MLEGEAYRAGRAGADEQAHVTEMLMVGDQNEEGLTPLPRRTVTRLCAKSKLRMASWSSPGHQRPSHQKDVLLQRPRKLVAARRSVLISTSDEAALTRGVMALAKGQVWLMPIEPHLLQDGTYRRGRCLRPPPGRSPCGGLRRRGDEVEPSVRRQPPVSGSGGGPPPPPPGQSRARAGLWARERC